MYTFGSSFRQEVASYVERCRLEDGGYFFARVLPSSGMDTYYAVKSLSLLGLKPSRPEEAANYFLSQISDSSLTGINGLFCAAEVLYELGMVTEEFKAYTEHHLQSLRNDIGGFGAYENIDVEVPSELRDTYRAVRTSEIIGADLDRKGLKRFVSHFLNADGGYGSQGHSTLASTYFASAIFKIFRLKIPGLTATKEYLRKRERNWQVQFIEDLYWLNEGLANLGEKPVYTDRVSRFVMECQRSNGGFSRATIMGIPTLEYTFYGLSILKQVDAI